jgi:serine/threonine protein kinase
VHEIRNGHYSFAEQDWKHISHEGMLFESTLDRMAYNVGYQIILWSEMILCLHENSLPLSAARDLIKKFLTVDPAARITVNEAMVSDYSHTVLAPTS